MITVFFDGRFGNNIFQYVFCRLISESNGYNFYIKHLKNEIIPSNINTIINSYHFDEKNPHYWNSDIFDIDFGVVDNNITSDIYEQHIKSVYDIIPDNSCLKGYFQDIKYYINNVDKIKSWLIPKNTLLSDNLLNKYDINHFCFIHFRGTDYKNIPQYYLPINYYIDAKNKMLIINNKLKFIIITDDIEESKKYFPDDIIISNDVNTDFMLLYSAKYSIICNSTFSWWSRFLSNGITVAPNGWTNYNTNKIDTLKYDNFMYI